MDIKLTPEVASIHKNLTDLCEKFESSVDEFCASPLQSLRTKDFYESECVPIAVECVDALSKFESARSYEITAYERTVAQADDTLRQQKRELEKSAAQRAKVYEGKIDEADDTLRQQKRKLEENAAQRTKTYKDAVAQNGDTLRLQKNELEETAVQSIIRIQSEVKEFSGIAKTVGVNLLDFTDVDPKEFLKKTTLESNSKLLYRDALSESMWASKLPNYVKRFIIVVISLAILVIFLRSEPTLLLRGIQFLHASPQPAYSFYTSLNSLLIGFFLFGFIVSAIVTIICYSKKKKKIAKVLQILRDAVVKECHIIRQEMNNEVIKVSTAHDKNVADIQAWKEQEDIQDAEQAAKVLAAHDENVADIQAWKEGEEKQARRSAAEALAVYNKETEEARSKINQAMAYIQQEHQAVDMRLCQCIDRFQLVVDTWLTENANATSVLNKNRLQDLNRNGKEIGSCLTRVGIVGIWDLSDKTSGSNQDNIKSAKPVTTVQSMKHTDDTQAVRHYLNTIANAEITTQPIGYTDDTQAVRHYLNTIASGQGNNEVQKNFETMAEQGNVQAQFTLGGMYEKGINVEKNEGEAVNWYRKATEQGNADAQYLLAGLTDSLSESMRWCAKAAEQGHTKAQDYLNKIEDADAQYQLGSFYEQEKRNAYQAVEWYRKAAEQGHSRAQWCLGWMHELGSGVEKDRAQAAKWHKKVRKQAEQGNAEAQWCLGRMFEDVGFIRGYDLPIQDRRLAIKWYQKAAEQGHDLAKKALRELEKG